MDDNFEDGDKLIAEPGLYEVTFTVKYKVRVYLSEGEDLNDVATEIEIPESPESNYVEDSFEVESTYKVEE